MASKLGRIFTRKFSARAPGTVFGDHGEAAAKGEKLWRNCSIFIVVPALALGAANVLLHEGDHERPEFIPYEHLRIHNKPYPWRDGVKGLFHNPHMNALPDGYVD